MDDHKKTREELIRDIAALRESEKKYRQWFEDAPISLWEQDFSEVKHRVDQIKEQVSGDLAGYFEARPELVQELARLVRVVDINSFTLQMYRAESKEDFLSGITRVFSMESYKGFIPGLVAVAEGRTRLVIEKTHATLDGEILHVQLQWSVVPGHEKTYDRVLVSIMDVTERTRALKALRASEEKYRLIADNMADTVWVLDMNLRFTYTSPSVMRMYGATVDEVMEQPIENSLTPGSLQVVQEAFAREMTLEALATGDPNRTLSLELEEYKKDGSRIWVESSMSFIRDGHQKPVAILGVSRDITTRKQAQMALSRSESMLRAVFENSLQSFLLIDRNRTIQYFNEMANKRAKMLFDRKMKVGDSIYDFIRPQDREGFEDHFARALEGGTLRVEKRMEQGKENVWYEFYYAPIRQDGRNVSGVFFQVMDITERKRAEEEYRLLALHSADVIYKLDLESEKYTYISPSVENVLGWTSQEAMALKAQDLVSPESYELQKDLLKRHLEKRDYSPVTFNVHAVHKDRRLVPVELHANLALDEKGAPAAIVGIARDITERERAENERLEMQRQLNQLHKSESLGRMAGAIAHHFNNQLQAVMGYLDLARSGLKGKKSVAREMEEAMNAARRAAAISGQMLTYLGQTIAERSPMDLSRVCRAGLSMLQTTLPENVTLETDLPSPGPVIKGNANELHQILANLVTNAWEAMEGKEGTIRMTIRIVATTDIPAENRFPIGWKPMETAYACLKVQDTGSGIALQAMEKLFDPFYTTRFPGRGMGLAIVLGIVKAHAGGITVVSRTSTEKEQEVKGRTGRALKKAGNTKQEPGSLFRVYLPLFSAKGPV